MIICLSYTSVASMLQMRIVNDHFKIDKVAPSYIEFLEIKLDLNNVLSDYDMQPYENSTEQDPSVRALVSNGLVPSFTIIYR